MRDYAALVNVFQGCDEIDLPKPEGVAASWRFIKGLCGNNNPGAVLPFGRISACCYSGGYSSGYGRLKVNSEGPIGKLFDRNKFRGISHLQNDGSGYIDTFYNYAVVSPFYGTLGESRNARDFINERAKPGYYACTVEEFGVDCEVTVAPRTALHKYTFPRRGGGLSIDFSNDGLYDDGKMTRTPPGECRLEIISDCEVAVRVVLHRLPIYFYVKFLNASSAVKLWVDDVVVDEKMVELDGGHTFGCVVGADTEVGAILGMSPKNAKTAQEDVLAENRSFEEVSDAAYGIWNEALSAVDAQFESEADEEVFYSNLYHSIIKPCDWSGESFLYEEDEFVLDFATLWDQYKTVFPLIFTLYKDMSRKIVETILNISRKTKMMPHQLMLDGDFVTIRQSQARMLAEHSIADAYFHGVHFDLLDAVKLMYEDAFENSHYDEFMNGSKHSGSSSFVIDITDACAAAAKLSYEAGNEEAGRRFSEIAVRWKEVFDEKTGLVRSENFFYEGTHWNYSFRLMHDMEGRMEIAGGKEKFIGLLDRFFGFINPEDESSCCFEGFNNETDMESPYAYYFAGRHDRLCEVIDGGLKYMFTNGRGGVPGNNDNGGLCSCYAWNTIGIFPVSGQDLMIIGSPRAKKTTMRLSNGNVFTITRKGSGIYVKSAELNGNKLSEFSFLTSEMMRGGDLRLEMTDKPAKGL